MMLNNGIGTAKNPSLALQWFEKSAKARDPLAAYKAGCYYSGQFKDTVAVDSEKSLQYKLVAAEAGYSLAQHDVANVYAQRNQFSNAIKWWEAAAKQGYPMSLYNLSVTYKEGKLVPKDNVLAYAYFKLANVISEGKISEKAQASLDDVKRSMTQAEFEQAEKVVSTWKGRAISSYTTSAARPRMKRCSWFQVNDVGIEPPNKSLQRTFAAQGE